MTSRIPPLLQPYVHVPPSGSLITITSVLGASANWLIIRYLCAALSSIDKKQKNKLHATLQVEEHGIVESNDVAVVLVSWLRDWEFWKTEARRAGGLDLARLHTDRRFIFVDGLTHLFSNALTAQEKKPPSSHAPSTPEVLKTSLASYRNTPAQARAAPPRPTTSPSTYPTPLRSIATSSPTPSPAPPRSAPSQQPTQASEHRPLTLTNPAHLTSPTLSHLTSTILTSITTLKSARILLILDTPSLLLHTTAPPITATALTTAILHLRSHVDSAIVALPADMPLSCVGADVTPLEADNAAFLVGMAHQSTFVMGCRRLGTGWAGDVSGVLRVTRGGGDCDGEELEVEGGDGLVGVDDDEARVSAAVVEEGEWLYHIGGDGTAKVWSRGSGDG